MIEMTPLFLGGLGGLELAIIAGVIILLFGANKIPELARAAGQAQGELEKGRKEVEEELSAHTEQSDEEDFEEDEDQ